MTDDGEMGVGIIEAKTEIAQSWQFPDFASLASDAIIENQIEYCDEYRQCRQNE